MEIRHVLCWCDRNYVAKWKNQEQFVQGRKIQSLIVNRHETMGQILKEGGAAVKCSAFLRQDCGRNLRRWMMMKKMKKI